MKIFLDCSDPELIREAFDTGLIDGVTTNPSLMLKNGHDPVGVLKEISEIFPFHASVSAEVVGNTSEEMLDMAEGYVDIGPNITIKVPCTPAGLKACKDLSGDDIAVNVTLCFSTAQAILAAKAGAAYVSPFVGRLDDNSIAGLQLIKDIDEVFRVQCIHRTKILSASIRYVNSVSQSFANGAHIVTMPPSVFEKMYNHVLTDKGLQIFDADFKETQKLIGG